MRITQEHPAPSSEIRLPVFGDRNFPRPPPSAMSLLLFQTFAGSLRRRGSLLLSVCALSNSICAASTESATTTHYPDAPEIRIEAVLGSSSPVLSATGLSEEQVYHLMASGDLVSDSWTEQDRITATEAQSWDLNPGGDAEFYRLMWNPAPQRESAWPGVQTLNDDWLYLERSSSYLPQDLDSAYEAVKLPHTWNALDSLQTSGYRRAASWYRKHLVITEAQLEQRLYLRFGAAGQRARVYLNGQVLVDHNGGYSAFTAELTGNLHVGDNQIDVWVTNQSASNIAPQSADFTFYGGLYRSVRLITGPPVSISRKHYGGPGYRIWSETVSATSSDVHVEVQVDNGTTSSKSLKIFARLLDLDGTVVSSGSTEITISANTTTPVSVSMPNVINPRLWSPERPELYRLQIALSDNGEVIDWAETNHGFRWFDFTAAKGFFLNGEPYPLRGVNRHQDFFEEGNALNLHRHYDDIKLIKETGANWLRLAHYQQDDYILQLCDQLGLLVWEEIPYVNGGDPAILGPTLHSMMKEMIEQHFNHPSIIIWGTGNEVKMNSATEAAAIRNLLSDLQDQIHAEDPVRPAGYVSYDETFTVDYGITDLIDVMGYNLYRGWYNSNYTTLVERLEELHTASPNTPLLLTEFGAGSDLTIHTETPSMQDFSVEYQNDFLAAHLDQIEQLDWLCGATWWNFADFGSANRGDSIPHVNQKGLVTFTRQKKDAFYLMKSRWSNEPVVYLESPFWTERDGFEKKNFQVFTNMNTVELFQNGISLGIQSEGFSWEVTLAEGDNVLLAIGQSGSTQREHGFTVHFEKSADYSILATAEQAGNPAIHLIDGNLSTRWAAQGEQSVTIDLKAPIHLGGVEIRFYQGENRTYRFNLQGSHDGQSWNTLFTGASSFGATVESYEFATQPEVRFLRIQCFGNNFNDWNSYYEITPRIVAADD